MKELWTLQKVLNWTIQHFDTRNIPEARLSAELLLADVLQCKRMDLYLQFERILTPAERGEYRSRIQRRLQREPVQYIIGETEFMGLPFTVNRSVLIPRADTEVLVDAVLEYARDQENAALNILDIGTGSGCIAVALDSLLPAAAIWAVEQQEEALETATLNIRNNQSKVALLNGDFFEIYQQINTRFNVIVTNPPYISPRDFAQLAPEVREYEPRSALIGGDDGLAFYRRLAPLARQLLTGDGRLFMEVGYDQAATVGDLFRNSGFQVAIRKDYQQIDRVLIVH